MGGDCWAECVEGRGERRFIDWSDIEGDGPRVGNAGDQRGPPHAV
jgi:hypothetical protein